MELSFEYGTKTIAFDVVYRQRKSLEISVEPPDIIKVVAPTGSSDKLIIETVKKKAKWIVKRLYLFKNMKLVTIKKEFVNGESFMYLGRNYTLEIELNSEIKKPEVALYQGKFHIQTPSMEYNLLYNTMENWYRDKAKDKIIEQVKYYEKKFDVKPTAVKVKEQKKRWGTCTCNNELLFNWRCIMAPAPILDYIIVHEICHIIEKNHSQSFWDLVSSILPDYENRKEWLKNNGVRMTL